jgi:hypothetical protein
MGAPTGSLPVLVSGPDGSFRFESLPDLHVRVSVSGDFVVKRRVEVDAGASGTVDVEVERAGVIEARVRDGVAPKKRWSLHVDPVGGSESNRPVLPSDDLDPRAARAGGLKPGRYAVRLDWDGQMSSVGEVEVVAGKTMEVVVPPK